MITTKQVIEEAMEWIDTPWQHQAMVKGEGVDCAMFVAGVALEVGLIEEGELDNIPNYPKDWHYHNTESQLIPILELFPVFQIPLEEVTEGDIVVFKVANCESHLGFYVEDGWFVHAFTSAKVKKVLKSRLDQRWTKRLTRAYRFENVE